MKSIDVIRFAPVIVAIIAIYSSVAFSKQDTFLKQVQMISDEVTNWFDQTKYKMKASWGATSDSYIQAEKTQCPKDIMRVLQVATGVSEESAIDMAKVIRITAGLKNDNALIQHEFIANFGQFLATKYKDILIVNDLPRKQKLKVTFKQFLTKFLHFKSKKQDLGELIVEAQDQLCSMYRRGTRDWWNVRKDIDDLMEMKELENIDDKEFIDRVILDDQPISRVYSVAMICQVIDGITGEKSKASKKLDLGLPSSSGDELADWLYVDDVEQEVN